MEPLKITSPQKHTPDVELDSASGILTFSGQCYIDNAEKFFRPIFEWIDEYLEEPGKSILFEMQLDYFNTSSAKCIWEMFLRFEKYCKEKNGNVLINWYFEEDDENTRELFEDFKAEVDLRFEHIASSW